MKKFYGFLSILTLILIVGQSMFAQTPNEKITVRTLGMVF